MFVPYRRRCVLQSGQSRRALSFKQKVTFPLRGRSFLQGSQSSRSDRPFDYYPDPYVFNAIDPVQMAVHLVFFVAVPIFVLMAVRMVFRIAVWMIVRTPVLDCQREQASS
jgi:hypothetical protein